ncbi:MAG TPA: hypothetical protein VGG13_03245 [Candidatus Saccharimonadales bacterium]|jgi:hypothetical protein
MGNSAPAKFLALNFLYNFAKAAPQPGGGGGGSTCTHNFFGIPTWYSYLKLNGSCQVINFQVPQDFLLILLALIDIGLHIAGLVAIGFVIYGGIQFVTSRGEPDQAAKARSTVIDALVGLMLALVSVGIVSFLGNRLG